MDMTIFALVSVIIGLLIVIAFLLGQRSRAKGDAKQKALQTAPPKTVRIDPAKLVQRMKPEKPPENPGCLTALESLWSTRLKTYAANYPDFILNPIYEPYAALVEFLRQGNNEEPAWDYFRQGIEGAKITDMRSNLDTTIAALPTPMVEEFHEEVQAYAEMYSDPTIKTLLLNQDHVLMESGRWAAVVRPEIVPVLSALSELQVLQQRCANLLPAAQKAAEYTGFEFSTLARHCGAGVLALANPFIGVPAAIASVASEFQKGKSHGKTIEDFNTAWGSYVEAWDTLAEQGRVSAEGLQPKIEARLHLFFQSAHEKLYARLDERGHSLKQALAYQQKKQAEFDAAGTEGDN